MTKCTKCGTENHAGAKFCRLCGTPLAPAVKAAAGAASAPQPAPTQALTHTPQFSPLAKGELLLEDRYEVMEPLSQSAARNTYIVKDGGCGKCGKFSGKGANYCEFCGAGLAQPRHYLLIEGSSERDVAGERLLAQCGVSGRRLINYHRAFEAAPAGTLIRSYVLADPVVTRQTPGAVCARRLTDLPPLSIDDAGRWLEAVAPAVAALLNANLWLPNIEAAQLLLVDDEVRLDAALTVQPYDPAQRTTILVQQAQAMGRLLRQLAAGTLPAAAAVLLDDPQRVLQTGGELTGWMAAVRSALHGISAAAPVNTPAAPVLPAPVKTQPLRITAADGPLAVQASALTDLGNVREINEDSLVKLEVELVHNSINQPLRLYAVADGMGGHAAGEVASRLAAQELTNTLIGNYGAALSDEPGAAGVDLRILLKEAGQAAAKAVYTQAQRLHTDMGTTLVAAVVDAKAAKAYAINVGDSRLYKLHGQSIRQVTKDHSMVQLLVDKQQLTPEEAHRHPNANLIYRTLGDKPSVEIDLYEEPLAAGDALLLCSDGLSGLVENAEMAAAVSEERTPDAACRRLVALAKQRGGHDNITVIIVQLAAMNLPNAAGAGYP